MGVYLPQTRLPSAYQEVEYIQSSGSQYIVLGTSFKTSYKTVIDFQMTATGGDQVVVGLSAGDTKRYGIDAWVSNFKVTTGGSYWSNTISEDTDRHTITINKTTAIVDGTSYSVSYSDYTFSTGIGVFAYNYSDGVEAYSKNKLYKLDIYDENGNHIYNLVPCHRKSDNVIGLYDLVNNQFYTNAGTGTFSKGNDVTMSDLKNAYIGEYRVPGENTLLYMPLSSNANDVKGHTTTTGGSVTFGTYGGVECANFTGAGQINITPFAIPASYTILARCNNINGYDNTSGRVFDMGNPRLGLAYNNQGYYTYENNSYFGTTTKNAWFLICAVVTNGSGTGYLKGNGVNQTTTIDVAPYSLTPSAMNVGNEYNNGANRHFLGYISNVIIEDKARTEQEITDYYRQTKGNYGL